MVGFGVGRRLGCDSDRLEGLVVQREVQGLRAARGRRMGRVRPRGWPRYRLMRLRGRPAAVARGAHSGLKMCARGIGGAAGAVGERRRSGMSPSMATIMVRALIWPVMLPRVSSGLRLASTQRRARPSRPHPGTSLEKMRFDKSVCILQDGSCHRRVRRNFSERHSSHESADNPTRSD